MLGARYTSYTGSGFDQQPVAPHTPKCVTHSATGRTVHGTDLPRLPAEQGLLEPLNWFEVSTRLFPDATELILIGELDQATGPIFEVAVATALRCGPPTLRLELSALEFLAVAGARAFDETRFRCERAGGGLVLLNPPRRIRRLLDLFELTHLVSAP